MPNVVACAGAVKYPWASIPSLDDGAGAPPKGTNDATGARIVVGSSVPDTTSSSRLGAPVSAWTKRTDVAPSAALSGSAAIVGPDGGPARTSVVVSPAPTVNDPPPTAEMHGSPGGT